MKMLLLAAPLCAFAAQAQAEDPLPELGRDLAQEFCVKCHDVEPGGAFKEYPPSFASIAVYRSAEQIRARILHPPYHVSMPEFQDYMIAGNVEDLVAYIQSLEP